MPLPCMKCEKNAQLKRPKTGDKLCKDCFYEYFEEEIHQTIVNNKLFTAGDTVAIGASGGKDSTVLAHIMKTLNERHSYGLNLILLSVDEGITGYRDDSLETVKRNKVQYDLPLKIISYEELYGWTMDDIVRHVGRKNNCTFCGVFRRQALDRGAMILKANKIVTGHNADDIAETVLMNILRGDIARLQRCTMITTGSDSGLPRCKPFKYTYEKEIVMYAYFKKLDYFSTECIYSPNAYRGHARAYLKDLEAIRPSSIIDIIYSGECMSVKAGVKMPTQGTCTKCGYISSQALCKACVLLEGLNRGLPRLGIGKAQRGKGKALLDSIIQDSLSKHSSAQSLLSSSDSLNSQQNHCSGKQCGGATCHTKSTCDGDTSDKKSTCDGDTSDTKSSCDGDTSDTKSTCDGDTSDTISTCDGDTSDTKSTCDGDTRDTKSTCDGGAGSTKENTSHDATSSILEITKEVNAVEI